MKTVRCGACRRKLGVSAAPPTRRVYCNEFCERDVPATGLEQRNDVIKLLHEKGLSALQIAIRLDMTRQRVSQILERELAPPG